MISLRFHHLIPALLLLMTAGCGGSGGGDGGGGGGGTVTDGGIGGTGISSGSISAFGSIVVNGTTFDVNAAEITINGDPNGIQDGLEIGYVVRVEGDLDDGIADKVRFEADLIGEVDANGIPSGDTVGTLTVMQQTVVITPTTVLKGVDNPDTIAASTRVLVSGFRDSKERLVATHLERAPAATTDQIVGRVDATGTTAFGINGLTIESNSEPDENDLVRVRGDYDPNREAFRATPPIEELSGRFEPGTDIELEGIVDRFNGESDFDVNGVTVDATGATLVGEADTPATLRQDAEVEIEGRFDNRGIVIADRVEVEVEDNVEVVAQVANDPGAGDPVQFFNANGMFELTVAVTNKTRLRDQRDDNSVENFAVADLAMGDWVELDAFEDASGNVTALKIERFTPDEDETVVVEGLVDSTNDPFIDVLGMTFDTSGTDLRFSTIASGDAVELEWDASTRFDQPMPVDDLEKED